MATILSFNLSSTPVSATSADHYAYFTPPSSIAGKLCYVHATFFGWDLGSAPTTAVAAGDVFQVVCDWVQPWSVTTTGAGSKVGAPLAFMNNNISSPSGPVLLRIPGNPHVVRFTVSRPDGGSVNGSTGTCYLNLCLKVIEADSRQPPLGV